MSLSRRLRPLDLSLTLALSAALGAGCYQGAGADTSFGGGGGGAPGSDASTADGSAASTDLPCAAAEVLSTYCWQCHGAVPSGGTSLSLVSHADLLAPSKSNSAKSNAALAVERMQSATSPMPPASSPQPSYAAASGFINWVTTGAATGSCSVDAGAGGSGGSDAGVASGDLPCDVAQTFASHCWQCHGATPSGGTTLSLVTRADLMAASSAQPSQSNAERSVARMQAATSPMPPPSGGVPAASIQAVADWVAAAYPAGSCGSGGDGGVVDPWSAPPGCASGSNWTRGDQGSTRMRPGGACVSCHTSQGEGPAEDLLGTVYASAHDFSDCNGINGTSGSLAGAYISVMDANHVEIAQVPVNSVGNFLGYVPNAATWYVAIVANGKSRAMTAVPTSGDCNSCHTQSGASNAPGRILIP